MLFFTEKKSESLLYSYFHEFHSELIRIKKLVQDRDWAQEMDEDGALPESLPFRADLLDLLDRQGLDAAQRGGEHGARLYRELKYLMVALADEFFLHLVPWDGRKIWHRHLLELSVFNTQAARQKVFEQIDTLLKRRDPITLELARIYLVVLALGFQGRYRDSEDQVKLDEYRRQLYFFITQRDPEQIDRHLYYDADLRIFPQAYDYTYAEPRQDNASQWLPVVSGWYLALLLLLGGLTLSSIVFWHWLSHDVAADARAVLANTAYYAGDYTAEDTSGRSAAGERASKGPSALEREAEARRRAEKTAAEAQLRLKDLERQLAAQKAEPPPVMAPPVPARLKLPQTLIWNDLSFAVGADVPAHVPAARLAELVELLAQNPQAQVLIKGHTDNTGTPELNLRLSQQRADAVRTLLLQRGIEAARIKAVGYGDQQPLADNATAEGRQRNRRVEIMVF